MIDKQTWKSENQKSITSQFEMVLADSSDEIIIGTEDIISIGIKSQMSMANETLPYYRCTIRVMDDGTVTPPSLGAKCILKGRYGQPDAFLWTTIAYLYCNKVTDYENEVYYEIELIDVLSFLSNTNIPNVFGDRPLGGYSTSTIFTYLYMRIYLTLGSYCFVMPDVSISNKYTDTNVAGMTYPEGLQALASYVDGVLRISPSTNTFTIVPYLSTRTSDIVVDGNDNAYEYPEKSTGESVGCLEITTPYDYNGYILGGSSYNSLKPPSIERLNRSEGTVSQAIVTFSIRNENSHSVSLYEISSSLIGTKTLMGTMGANGTTDITITLNSSTNKKKYIFYANGKYSSYLIIKANEFLSSYTRIHIAYENTCAEEEVELDSSMILLSSSARVNPSDDGQTYLNVPLRTNDPDGINYAYYRFTVDTNLDSTEDGSVRVSMENGIVNPIWNISGTKRVYVPYNQFHSDSRKDSYGTGNKYKSVTSVIATTGNSPSAQSKMDGTKLLDALSKNISYDLDWRYDPRSEVGDAITVRTKDGTTKNCIVTSHTITYDGGLSAKTRCVEL